MPARPWTVTAHGLVLTVRLTPKGGRDTLEGIDRLADGQCVLKARVRAPPSEGEANAALVRLLAGALEIAPRRVAITAGTTARIKRVSIEGDAAHLAERLEKIAARG
jgi:uncharacterized protein YggU (UPF0235/DUF167 family)